MSSLRAPRFPSLLPSELFFHCLRPFGGDIFWRFLEDVAELDRLGLRLFQGHFTVCQPTTSRSSSRRLLFLLEPFRPSRTLDNTSPANEISRGHPVFLRGSVRALMIMRMFLANVRKCLVAGPKQPSFCGGIETSCKESVLSGQQRGWAAGDEQGLFDEAVRSS